jgi:hypothetical protein
LKNELCKAFGAGSVIDQAILKEEIKQGYATVILCVGIKVRCIV